MNKWDLEKTPEEFYQEKIDPFGLQDNFFEIWKIDKVIEFLYRNNRYYNYIADIGCGEGYFTKYYLMFAYNGLFGFDISKTAINRAEDKYNGFIQFRNCDITKEVFPFYFDLMILSEMLYYIKPEDRQQMKENLYSKLNENGNILIINSQVFSENEIKDIFSECDFETVEYEYTLLPSKKTLIMIGKKNR